LVAKTRARVPLLLERRAGGGRGRRTSRPRTARCSSCRRAAPTYVATPSHPRWSAVAKQPGLNGRSKTPDASCCKSLSEGIRRAAQENNARQGVSGWRAGHRVARRVHEKYLLAAEPALEDGHQPI